MAIDQKEHWSDIYDRKDAKEVSWFQTEPKMSLNLIKNLQLDISNSILDVGAGASTLVDFLLRDGFKNIYLLELAQSAFDQTRKRLASRSNEIQWLVGDVRDFKVPVQLDLWHDRAVFHFLTQSEDQESYVKNLNASLKVGAYFIIATFAEDGPLKCSGLEIVRYSKEELVNKVGKNFELLDFQKETHISPSGMEQKFNYWVFKRVFSYQ